MKAPKKTAPKKTAEDFNPFKPKPGQEEMQKAFWAAHWASNPSSGELYDGDL